jgi:hypothetical protein
MLDAAMGLAAHEATQPELGAGELPEAEALFAWGSSTSMPARSAAAPMATPSRPAAELMDGIDFAMISSFGQASGGMAWS